MHFEFFCFEILYYRRTFAIEINL